jgi:hypothetical protein
MCVASATGQGKSSKGSRQFRELARDSGHTADISACPSRANRRQLTSVQLEARELDHLRPFVRFVGVGLVHDWAPPWPEGLSIKKLSLPPNRFGRRLGLIWSRASIRARLVHAFLEVAVDSLAEGMARAPKRKGRARRRQGCRSA